MARATTSFPKSKMRIVLAEKVHPSAADCFREAGYQVEETAHALQGDELADAVADAHILGVRSRTKVRAEHLAGARRLLAIGCFSVGTDQVDLEAATRRGVPVFNAPYSSTRSVAELALCAILNLARGVPRRSARMHLGKWDKSVQGSVEVRGKTLGIIGYGHIGQQVGLLGEALGMNVLYYDVVRKLPLGRVSAVRRLGDLLAAADYVTLHVPGGESTDRMMAAAEMAAMKRGAFLVNMSRGTVVDIEALRQALESGHLGGAALDVFPQEPSGNDEPFQSSLRGRDDVVLTPHVGGSTEEAQANIGREVASALTAFLDCGSSEGAVNFPSVTLPSFPNAHRILNVHRNLPGVLSDINRAIADVGANIEAQYLNTYRDVGYLIMDVDKKLSAEAKERIAALPASIRTRILY